MSAREIQIEFERLIQLINPEFIIDNKLDSDTIFNFFNIAQERYMKSIYVQLSSTDKNSSEYMRLLESCKSLTVSKTLEESSPVVGYQHAVKFKIPDTIDDKFFLYLESYSNITNGTYQGIQSNILMSHTDLDKILVSMYNNPILRKPVVVLENEDIVIYHDTKTTINSCVLMYIRKPKDVNNMESSITTETSELSDNITRDVIAMAVDVFIREGAYRLIAKQEGTK